MSAGPIKAWRDGSVSPRVSTTNVDRVCMTTGRAQAGYCGRRGGTRAQQWKNVTCADCSAAARADGMEIE